jgi:hypothetical protein
MLSIEPSSIDDHFPFFLVKRNRQKPFRIHLSGTATEYDEKADVSRRLRSSFDTKISGTFNTVSIP